MEYLEFRHFRKIFYLNYSKILDFHLFIYSYLLILDFIFEFLQFFFVYFQQTYSNMFFLDFFPVYNLF
jgi:hypothetical protein